MKKLHIIKILFLLLCESTFCQTKEMKGDTAYSYKSNIETFHLKDFEKSSDDFNFRFRNLGQIIEISKNGSNYSGSIINFIYHTKKSKSNKTEILSKEVIISSEQSKDIYSIVQNAGILDLPSDNDIAHWRHGFDGITYIIEHADLKTYWLKNYWTPSAQDSIPEAIIVLDLLRKLTDTLKLQETYTSFKNTLPKKGCYNSGGITNMCYVSNSLVVGYMGATKLPLGFYSSYSATYIGKTAVNGSIALQYNFSNGGFYHLNFQSAKGKIFYKKSTFSDFIAYNYQNRAININETKNKFGNHQIKYGFNLRKNIAAGIGLDCISGDYRKLGAYLFAYKWLSKPDISTVLTTSIFNNQVNYKAEVLKSFNFNSRFPVQQVSLGVAYEDFMNYKDVYFSVRTSL